MQGTGTGCPVFRNPYGKELGISRTPMREALQCLSQDGYITIIPSRGFQICQLNEDSMRESIQIRCAIEGFCVHYIVSQTSKKHCQKLIRDLEKSLERQQKALTAPDFPRSFIEEDHQFSSDAGPLCGKSGIHHLFQRLMYMIHLTTSNALSITGVRLLFHSFLRSLLRKMQHTPVCLHT